MIKEPFKNVPCRLVMGMRPAVGCEQQLLAIVTARVELLGHPVADELAATE